MKFRNVLEWKDFIEMKINVQHMSFSGVLGMLMNMSAIRLHELNTLHSLLDLGTVQILAKVFISYFSRFLNLLGHKYTFTTYLYIPVKEKQ